MDDVELTFNPKQFIDAIQQINSKMDAMVQNTKKSAEGMSKSMQNALYGITAQVKQLIVQHIGLNAILAKIPEIGKTFEFLGNVFDRNLLWPLRKELAPYLQKVLDWARDHRNMFVKWGQTLANIFRGLVQVVKGVLEALKPIFQTFRKIFKDAFGSGVKDISDVLNILVFRVTVVALAIVEALYPVMNIFAKIIEVIYGLGKAFIEGFSEGSKVLGTWSEVINGFAKSFDALMKAIGVSLGSDGFGGFYDIVKKIMFILGDLTGGALKMFIRMATDILNILTALITGDSSRLPSWLIAIAQAAQTAAQYIAKPFEILGEAITWVVDKIKEAIGYVTDSRLGKAVAAVGKFLGMGSDKDQIQPGTVGGGGVAVRPTTINAPKHNQISSTVKMGDIRIENASPEEADRFGKRVVSKAHDDMLKIFKNMLAKDMVTSQGGLP